MSATVLRSAGIAVLMTAAAYWWWTMAGPNNRYLYPFVLMSCLWVLRSVARWVTHRSARAQGAVIVYCVTPPLLLIVLLWLPTPSVGAQSFLGVNLTTSMFVEEARLAEKLLRKSARRGRPVWVSTVGSAREGAVIAPFQYEYCIVGERRRSLAGINMCDWRREPGLRVDELNRVDFLLCDRTWIPKHPVKDSPVRNYHEEVAEFFRFLTESSPRDGIELFHDSTLAAYQVVDRDAFRRAVRRWARTVSWESGFTERNAAFLAEEK